MDIDLESLARDFVNHEIVIGYKDIREATAATALLREAGVPHGGSGVSENILMGRGDWDRLKHWDSIIYIGSDGGIEYCYFTHFTRFHCERVMFDELAARYPSGEDETEYAIDAEIFKEVFQTAHSS